MAGLSRYEKWILAATAAFVLFTGGYFAAQRSSCAPYRVTTTRQETVDAGEPASRQPQEDDRPDSLLEGEVIDLNAADIYELQRLPGIGEKRAQAIVDWREENGPFQSVDELLQVPGIGNGILSGLAGYVTVSETAG